MTREEAIAYWTTRSEHIHEWLKENEDVEFIGEYVEAIDMAISALSATNDEKVQNCGDLISRADAIEMAVDVETPQGTYERAIYVDDLMALPSADRPSGEWIPLDGKLPKVIGHHVLVTIKWADDDLEVCEMCPTVADRYNIIAFQELPEPYQGETIKSELQCSGARMKGGAE